jgi:hypothetical protein
MSAALRRINVQRYSSPVKGVKSKLLGISKHRKYYYITLHKAIERAAYEDIYTYQITLSIQVDGETSQVVGQTVADFCGLFQYPGTILELSSTYIICMLNQTVIRFRNF